jgi:hypothetical protein
VQPWLLLLLLPPVLLLLRRGRVAMSEVEVLLG